MLLKETDIKSGLKSAHDELATVLVDA